VAGQDVQKRFEQLRREAPGLGRLIEDAGLALPLRLRALLARTFRIAGRS